MAKTKRDDLPEVYKIENLARIEWLPSSVPRINFALGLGLPRKGIVETYGPPSGGKTTMALTFQPDIYIDIERSLEYQWASRYAPQMLYSQPETLEQAFMLVEHVLRGKPRLVVLDSLGGGVSERELDSKQQGTMAKATSTFLRKIVNMGLVDESCLLIVNQLRASFNPYGSPVTTPGGWVLEHLALMRVEVRRVGWIEVGEKKKKMAQEILIRVTKNKAGIPWSEATVVLDFNGVFYPTVEEYRQSLKARGGGA